MGPENVQIPHTNELSDIIRKNGLSACEIEIGTPENMIYMSGDSLQAIIDLAIKFDRKVLFYQYTYLNEEDLALEEEETNRYGEEVPSVVKKAVKEHNRKVKNIDLSLPAQLSVFCLYEGHAIGINITDDNIAEIMVARGSVVEEAYGFAEEAEETATERTERRKKLHDELKELIMNDAEFGKMTNKELRGSYFRTLLEKPENKKYAEIFRFDRRGGPIWVMREFQAVVWNEYKEKWKN